VPYTVALRTVAFDTRTLRPGERRLQFFHGRAESPVDDTALPEEALVEWLFREQLSRDLLLEVLDLGRNARWAARVTEPFVKDSQSRPGDVDVLIASVHEPHRAVALECKRVRVRAGDETGQRVNRLDGLGRAPSQVNGLLSLGFARTYLTVIVVAHDLSDTSYNYVSRGTREATFNRIVHFAEALELDEAAGILYVEVSQPLLASALTSGVVSAAILRPAPIQEQPGDLTDSVRRYLSERGRGA
jgi:hypothetical protein